LVCPTVVAVVVKGEGVLQGIKSRMAIPLRQSYITMSIQKCMPYESYLESYWAYNWMPVQTVVVVVVVVFTEEEVAPGC
jgi:hypothetical protein